jgi:hypothetical protein
MNLAGAGLLALLPFRSARGAATPTPPTDAVRAQFQDLRTDWFAENRQTLIVRAEDLITGEAKGLVADEGSHQQRFDVSPENMAKLKRGEAVKIETAEAVATPIRSPSTRRSIKFPTAGSSASSTRSGSPRAPARSDPGALSFLGWILLKQSLSATAEVV